MVQKQEYIDFQEVNPSPLHFEEVQNECKPSASRVQVAISAPSALQSVGKRVLKKIDHKVVGRVASVARKTAIISGVICAVLYGLYLIGVYTINALAGLAAMIVEASFFKYVAVGGVALLIALIVAYVISQVESAPKFDDWNPRRKGDKKKATEEHVTINQTVNIYK